jgi:anaerobic magnesium-protoporphyrin IX monomethyl ester cyclase
VGIDKRRAEMKITFVYPGIAMIGFNSLGGNCHDTISVNLGMGYMASYIRQHSRHTVDLIDLRDLKGWPEYAAELAARSPDIVGIYCNTVNFENALSCARAAKEQGRTVIMGGPHATLDPAALIETGLVDTVITGEGELSFLKCVNGFAEGKPPAKIVEGEKVDDLDSLPFPDRGLYNMRRILKGAGIFPYPNRYIGIIASRGCYYNCSFCQPLERKIFGRKVRVRSVENIIGEIREVITTYRANFIMFECDTLTTHKEWALQLCRRMKELGIAWGAQSRADTIDDELAAAMHDSGCMVLFIGFESGSPRMLELLKKGITPEDSRRAGRVCRRHKLLIFANYMLGMPTETREDFEMTLAMLCEIKPELHSVAYFSPIPGSELYDFCKANDLIRVSSFEGFVRNAVNEKVKGIDYALADEYKQRISRCRTYWWTEWYFARHVLSRWLFLLSHGYLKEFIIEFAGNCPAAVALVNRIRKMKKRK